MNTVAPLVRVLRRSRSQRLSLKIKAMHNLLFTQPSSEKHERVLLTWHKDYLWCFGDCSDSVKDIAWNHHSRIKEFLQNCITHGREAGWLSAANSLAGLNKNKFDPMGSSMFGVDLTRTATVIVLIWGCMSAKVEGEFTFIDDTMNINWIHKY